MSKGGRCTDNTDIFSLGVNLYEMCFMEHPWPQQDTVYQTLEIQKQILKGKKLNFNGKKRKISKKLQNLLNGMLKFEDDKRMTFEKLFSHEFFQKELEADLQKIKLRMMKSETKKSKRPVSLENPKGLAESDSPSFKKEKIDKTQPLSHIDVDKIDKKFCKFLNSIRNPVENIEELNKNNEKSVIQIIDELMKESKRKQQEQKEPNKKKEGPAMDEFSNFGNDKNKKLPNGDKSHFEYHNLAKITKKSHNKIIFLKYLDKKIKKFHCNELEISIPNKNALRLMIQKIKIGIIFNTLGKIEKNGKNLESPGFSEFSSYNNNLIDHEKFMKFLGESMKKFQKMQETVLKEISDELKDIHVITFCKIPCCCTIEKKNSIYSKKNIDWVLDLLNPQINENEFLDLFGNLLDPIMKPMIQYITSRKNIKFFEIQEEMKKIVSIYKDFLVLLNIEHVFNQMDDDNAEDFSEETIVDCEESEFNFGQLMKKLGI